MREAVYMCETGNMSGDTQHKEEETQNAPERPRIIEKFRQLHENRNLRWTIREQNHWIPGVAIEPDCPLCSGLGLWVRIAAGASEFDTPCSCRMGEVTAQQQIALSGRKLGSVRPDL